MSASAASSEHPAPEAGDPSAPASANAPAFGTVASTVQPDLEAAVRTRLIDLRIAQHAHPGPFEPLEMLALRLALIQQHPRPRLRQPQLVIFAGDHGLAVEVADAVPCDTESIVGDLLDSRLPLPVLAHLQGVTTHVVDCGLANTVETRPGMLARKIAHGTRNCRFAQAMTQQQVQAAMRAGRDIVDALPGNVLACAGLGMGSHAVSALLLSQLTGLALDDIILPRGADPTNSLREQHLNLLRQIQRSQNRHAALDNPLEALAAFGGFETAMMVGAMIAAASRRHLLIIEGLNACAALAVAERIAGPVGEYAMVASRLPTQASGPGDRPGGHEVALSILQAQALPEMHLQGIDGTGIPLSWPWVQAAASLLSDVQPAPGGPPQPATSSPQAVPDIPPAPAAETAETQPSQRAATTEG
jgi:nicotinate-nucleotide--dimethylbenzimidazole phosphoribosyltransferase